jgi:4-amino-4-deoxy-L-arabinose transferase-like glycosyltransferase
MAKKLTLFSLRLMLLNVVSIFIMLLMALWQNDIYQWIITVFVTFALMYFAWRDAEAVGQKDFHNDRLVRRRAEEEKQEPTGNEGRLYKKWFGFAAGLLSQVPAIILLAIACIVTSKSALFDALVPITRVWYFSYLHIMTLCDSVLVQDALPYIMFLFAIAMSVVAGLAYLHGPAVDKKLETIIERNKAKKPMRMQDEWALEKKRKARRGIK